MGRVRAGGGGGKRSATAGGRALEAWERRAAQPGTEPGAERATRGARGAGPAQPARPRHGHRLRGALAKAPAGLGQHTPAR